MSTASLRTLAAATVLGFLCPACIITTSGDDESEAESTGDDGDPPPPTSGLPSDSSGGPVADDTTDDGPIDETTGGPVGECTDNLVLDPGFEAGTPSEAWLEASDVFDTPICNTSCTEEEGAAPYAGEWWGWFGGVEDEPESASLAQTITIDPEMAYLSFWFQIRSGAGTGDDVFTATLGGDTLFMVTDLDMPDYDQYQRVDVDVSQWADGGSYELRFSSSHTGNGLTSFFLDEVSLVSCTEAAGTSTGPDTDGVDDSTSGSGDSTTGGSTTGDTDGTTGGSTGGSSGSSTGAG